MFSAGGDLATLKQQAQDQETEAMKVLVEKVAEIILYMTNCNNYCDIFFFTQLMKFRA